MIKAKRKKFFRTFVLIGIYCNQFKWMYESRRNE